MNRLLNHNNISIGKRLLIYNRKFLNFQLNPQKYRFCAQIKEEKSEKNPYEPKIEENEIEEDIDIDTLKNEMFEDFEMEKENIQQTNTNINDINQIDEDNIDKFNMFGTGSSITSTETDKNDNKNNNKLSFAAEQFKKRVEFNNSLRSASMQKSRKSVVHSSSSLSSGIPEIIYDIEDTDQWLQYVRLYTFTPFTMGLFLVPIAIFGYPEWELFPKLCLGSFYMITSSLFPYASYIVAKNRITKCWLKPDLETLIFERNNFFFQPYKQEYKIKDIRVSPRRGSEKHCYFQCMKTKHLFLLVSELMQHPVWLQLLCVTENDIADAKMRSIANDGNVTMFRGI